MMLTALSFVTDFFRSRVGRYALAVLVGVVALASLLVLDARRIRAAEARGRAQAIAEAAARVPAAKAAVDSAVRQTDRSGSSVDSAIVRVDAALEAARAAQREARRLAPRVAPVPAPSVAAEPLPVAVPDPVPDLFPFVPPRPLPGDTAPNLVRACTDLRNSCAAFREDVTRERAVRLEADRARDLEDVGRRDRIRDLERRPSRKVAVAAAVGAAVLGFLAGRQ